MLISLSIIWQKCLDHPAADGVIRVDNYWCHSAILSTRPKETVSLSSSKPKIIGDAIDNSSDNSNSNGGGSSGNSGERISSSSSSSSSSDNNDENIISNSDSTKNVPQFDSNNAPSKNILPIKEKTKNTDDKTNNVESNLKNDIQNKLKKFDPRARLKEMKKFSEMKGGPAFAAKLRSKARSALLASKSLVLKNSNNSKDLIMIKTNDGNEADMKDFNEEDVVPIPKILAVDLPGMSFITLFCDDQKVSGVIFCSNYHLFQNAVKSVLYYIGVQTVINDRVRHTAIFDNRRP